MTNLRTDRGRGNAALALVIAGLGWLFGFLVFNGMWLFEPVGARWQLPGWAVVAGCYVLVVAAAAYRWPQPAVLGAAYLGAIASVTWLASAPALGWESLLFGALYGTLAFAAWVVSAYVVWDLLRLVSRAVTPTAR